MGTLWSECKCLPLAFNFSNVVIRFQCTVISVLVSIPCLGGIYYIKLHRWPTKIMTQSKKGRIGYTETPVFSMSRGITGSYKLQNRTLSRWWLSFLVKLICTTLTLCHSIKNHPCSSDDKPSSVVRRPGPGLSDVVTDFFVKMWVIHK